MSDKRNIMDGSFCSAPYIATYIGTQGEFTPCCIFNYKNKLSTYSGNDDILSHMNSAKAVQLRKDLHEGKKPAGCRHCWELEDRGELSLRHHFNTNYHYEDIVEATNSNNFLLPDLKLRYIDIRFSNKCNLKCVSCGADWSTSWYNDSVALNVTKPGTPKLKSIENTENLLIQLYDQIDNIEQIYFAGGEPLMLPEHYKLLQEIIKRGKAKDINLLYSSNLARLTYGVYDVVPFWKEFSSISMQASIDGTYKRGEYLRTNLKWDQLVSNVERLIKEVPQLDLNIAPTVSWMNSYDIIDLHKEWVSKEYIKVNKIHANILHSPSEFSLWRLPNHHLKALKKKYIQHIEWISSLNVRESEKRQAISAFRKIIGYLERGSDLVPGRDDEGTYSNYHERIDKIRKVDFFKIFPEFLDLKPKSFI